MTAARLSAPDAVLVAQEHLRLRSWGQAAEFCQSWLATNEGVPALNLCLASAFFGLGQKEHAMELVEEVLAGAPEHTSARMYRAQMSLFGGATGAARARALADLRAVVGREPDYPGAQGALASVLMPGPYYRVVLRAIHDLLAPRTYLEIGVETGATLALAERAQLAVGVDPVDSLQTPLPSCAHLELMESDVFFRQNSRVGVFGELPLDLVFIDGMHLFEYALRDFVNVESWSHANTVVVFHDCLPTSVEVAARERRTKFWAGDTWKVREVLRQYRPELRISIVPTPPSGLMIVRGLNAASTALPSSLPDIEREYLSQQYPYEPGNWPRDFNLVSNDDLGLRMALGRT